MDRTKFRAAMMAAAGLNRDLDNTTGRLAQWFEGRVGTNVAIHGLKVPEGAGLANETLLFDVSFVKDGARQTKGFVIRVKPFAVQLFPDPDFDGLYRLLDTLSTTGLVKAPRVFWREDDPSIFGAPFFVMERLIGRVPVSQPAYTVQGWLAEAAPADRHTAWRTAVEGLASVHNVPGDQISFIGWPQHGQTGEDQQIGYWEAYAGWSGVPIPDEVTKLGQWVRDHRPNDPGIHLSWGDARIGNMIFAPNHELIGVLDWDQMCLANPRHDLAWWIFFDRTYTDVIGVPRPEGMGDIADTIGLWEDKTGLKAGDLTWYQAYVIFKLALISMRTYVSANGPVEKAQAQSVAMVQRGRAALGI